MDREEILLLQMARAVESRLRKGDVTEYASELRIGADGTPTTVADDLAEREVLRVLEAHGNPWNVLSEECGFVDHGARTTLVLDPVDGTRNAGRGVPFYCVSLALCERSMSDARIGVIRNLVNGDTYVAKKGKGATVNGRHLPITPFNPSDAVVSMELGQVLAGRHLASKPFTPRALGAAALDLALVAQGALDAYVHLPPRIRVIDVAAGALLVREAGGEVFDRPGAGRATLDMPLELGARTPIAAVRGKEALHLLEAFP